MYPLFDSHLHDLMLHSTDNVLSTEGILSDNNFKRRSMCMVTLIILGVMNNSIDSPLE